MELIRKHWIKLAIGAGVAACAYAYFAGRADAADLGGNCCSDLEERIAELEATTARKGTKKVSLEIAGRINKAIWYYDVEDFSDTFIVENGASETYFSFNARAVISDGFVVGGVVEVGQGKTGLSYEIVPGPDTFSFGTDNDLYTRRSFVYAETKAGNVSVGLISMATDDLSTSVDVANTGAATKRNTFHPLGGVVVSFGPFTLIDVELEPFNGQKANGVRYDSPTFAGFSVSAAWESGSDAWDAALRFSGDGGGFAFKAAAGYEKDKADDLLSIFGDVETTTISLNAGVKHTTSGIFAQGQWARYEIDAASIETDAWHVQGGWEGKKLFPFGPTTIWIGYQKWDDLDLTAYELGFNQNMVGAVDAYIIGKRYEIGDVDATSVLGGMRVKF